MTKSTYQPPYTITPEILNQVAAISEAIGRLTVLTDISVESLIFEHQAEHYLKPALDDGLIEMTIPDKLNSRLQKYRLTDKGRQWLAQHGDG